MKRITVVAMAGAVSAVLAVGLMPAPASAVEASSLRGEWIGTGTGFMSKDGMQVEAQGRLVFKKAKGDDVRAQWQWRSCEPRPNKCKSNDSSGGGWSAKDTVLFSVDDDLLFGVEDEAMWDGHMLPDGDIHMIAREMQGGAPITTPLIFDMHFVKVS